MPNKAFIKFASYFGILVGCFNILIGIGSDHGTHGTARTFSTA